MFCTTSLRPSVRYQYIYGEYLLAIAICYSYNSTNYAIQWTSIYCKQTGKIMLNQHQPCSIKAFASIYLLTDKRSNRNHFSISLCVCVNFFWFVANTHMHTILNKNIYSLHEQKKKLQNPLENKKKMLTTCDVCDQKSPCCQAIITSSKTSQITNIQCFFSSSLLGYNAQGTSFKVN